VNKKETQPESGYKTPDRLPIENAPLPTNYPFLQLCPKDAIGRLAGERKGERRDAARLATANRSALPEER
jgi:hypothetical protein